MPIFTVGAATTNSIMAIPHTHGGVSLDAIVNVSATSDGKIVLPQKIFRQVDLGTARHVKSITIMEFPYHEMRTEFANGGSHWRIGISCTSQSPEHDRILNAALHIASSAAKAKMIKRKGGLWCLRLQLPLSRSGEFAAWFVETSVTPIVYAAGDMLATLGQNMLKGGSHGAAGPS